MNVITDFGQRLNRVVSGLSGEFVYITRLLRCCCLVIWNQEPGVAFPKLNDVGTVCCVNAYPPCCSIFLLSLAARL